MPIMDHNWRDQQRYRKKAEKVVDQTHLTYCWLRADQAAVQLGQLKRSHELTPVCLEADQAKFPFHMEKALGYIEELKSMIKEYQQHLKNKAGKK